MTLREVTNEIAAKVAWLEEHNGATIHKKWLVGAILGDHEGIEGPDAEFALCCARFTVEQHVDKYFRTVRQNEEDQMEQDLLPGFERLQKRYICERDGEQMIVKIHDMTDDEIDAKVAQHRLMGDGHYRHADELLRFKSDKKQAKFALG